MSGALEGIRVLDLTWVLAGPYSTMLLGDMGAEIIKIERLKVGDIARGNGPHINGVSSYFMSLNRNKKSVTLNLASQQGRDIFLKLAAKSDIVVENFVPGTVKKLGIDYNTVKDLNSRIIYASCSGFGQYGPYSSKPALDIIVQSMGGLISITGEPNRPPVRPGISVGDLTAGLFLTISILAALNERHSSGQGQYIDISMLDCQVALLENAFSRYFATGEVPKPVGTRHPIFTPFQIFPTRDGYIAIGTMGGAQDIWPLFCATINRLDLIDDERFQTGWSRTQNYEALEPIMNDALITRTTDEWIKEFDAVNIPCGPVNTIDKAAADPQINARNMFVEVQHPKAGNFKIVNTPFKFSRTPASVQQASPDLGQNTDEILNDLLGISNSELNDLREKGII